MTMLADSVEALCAAMFGVGGYRMTWCGHVLARLRQTPPGEFATLAFGAVEGWPVRGLAAHMPGLRGLY